MQDRIIEFGPGVDVAISRAIIDAAHEGEARGSYVYDAPTLEESALALIGYSIIIISGTIYVAQYDDDKARPRDPDQQIIEPNDSAMDMALERIADGYTLDGLQQFATAWLHHYGMPLPDATLESVTGFQVTTGE